MIYFQHRPTNQYNLSLKSMISLFVDAAIDAESKVKISIIWRYDVGT